MKKVLWSNKWRLFAKKVVPLQSQTAPPLVRQDSLRIYRNGVYLTLVK